MMAFIKRRLIARCLPWFICFVFFPCLGLLFVSLPSSKTPLVNYANQLSISSVVPVSITRNNNNNDDDTSVILTASKDEPVSYKLNGPLFFEESVGKSDGEDACVPPILQPDGSSLPRYRQSQQSCLQKNGRNPITVAVMEVTDPDDRTKKINRSVIIPAIKNNPSMNWKSAAAITCNYSSVVAEDDFRVRFDPPRPLGRLPTRCPYDVFQINCTYPTNNETLQENNNASKLETFSAVFRCMIPQQKPKPQKHSATRNNRGRRRFEEQLNIILIGLDSLSRVTWLEQLPQTSKYFTEELGAISLEGYNIVGDGTTVAFMALFAGHFYNELHEARRGFPNASPLDDFPFLWRELKEQSGYVTLYDEDQPSIGTFQHRMMGFDYKPVDYYGRPFQLAYKEKFSRIYDCLGSLPTYEEMLSQIKQLFAIHPDPQRKLALLFNGAHSRPAFDGTQDVTHLDSIMLAALQGLARRNHLNSSVVVLFSDHGARNGKNRASARGKLEERMPFMSLAFPDWFLRKYPEEMKHLMDASRKMTTPFDIHRTLQDIGGVILSKATASRKGLSLFEPLPADRTCKDAGVLPHWCSCIIGAPSDLLGSSVPRRIDNIPIQSFLDVFKKFANEALLPVEELCEPLEPRDPFIVTRMPENLVQISFYTDPGNGQWEVMFAIDRSDGRNVVITVADNSQISRTNSYGNAPFCIRETYPHLREFCYCTALSQH